MIGKQKIPLSFEQGIQTKIDDFQQPLGTFRRLENVIFPTIKSFKKRNGYDEIKLQNLDESFISNAKSITSFLNELCLFTDKKLSSYVQGLNRWVDKGEIYNVFPQNFSILRNNYEQKNLDVVSIDGIDCFVFEDDNGIGISILDRNTGNFVLSNELVSASGALPKLAHINNSLYVFYVDSADLNYRKINILVPTTLGSEVTVVSDVDGSNPHYDTSFIDGSIIVAYNSSNAGSQLRLFYIDSADNVSSITALTSENADNFVTVEIDSANRVLVLYSDGSDVKLTIRTANLIGETVAPTSIETISNAINGTININVSGTYDIIYQISAATDYNHYLKLNTINLAGTVGTPSVLIRSVGLASKSFLIENEVYFLTIFVSEFQSTYFLVTSSGNVAAKLLPGVSGIHLTENGLPKVTNLGDSQFLTATQIKGQIVTDDATFYSVLGVNRTVLDFDIKDPYQNKPLSDNLHISAGYLYMYDGKQVVEHGYHVYPETLVAGTNSSSGGSMSDGTFQYSAVYAWRDNKGRLHRSAPSIPISVTTTAGGTSQTQEIDVPTLRLTNKQDVIIELYRTEDAGTVFYKVTSTTSPTFNSTSADTVTITDTLSDTSLISREILYTTGGVLENIAAPSSSIIETFNTRILLAGGENDNEIIYSKETAPGAPVEFNDTLSFLVNALGGPVTAVKVMDDNIIIFKRDAIYYVTGNGPNNLGQQNNFTEPELITAEVGCVDVRSVLLTPAGLIFKSPKGFYLLSRGLQYSYIGSNVEAYNNLTVSSAIAMSDRNELRFTTKEGECLVYDYFIQQWTTFSNHEGLAAVLLQSEYYYLRSDGLLYKQSSGYADNGSSIKLLIDTGWMSLNQLQGFKRVYKMLFLGKFKGNHRVRIKVAYDFNPAWIDEYTIIPTDFVDSNAYGDYSPYGEPDTVPYGNDGIPYQYRIDFTQQKCQSIRIQFEELEEINGNEALEMSGLTFEVGGKTGLFKVPSTQTRGES